MDQWLIEYFIAHFKQTEKILGFEINPNYVAQIAQDEQLCQDTRIQVHQNNFFDFIQLFKRYSIGWYSYKTNQNL